MEKLWHSSIASLRRNSRLKQPPLGPHPAMPGIAVVASVMKFKGIPWPWDPNPLDIQKHTAKGDPDRYMMIYVV